ncbi:unnamed protein product [Clavelina lepadiformis]|uniref:Uncharacterized protein n=1 Tax=Clavelina lepadiformis TaxID=159417 RepID=A0ABP0GLR3_CLALP
MAFIGKLDFYKNCLLREDLNQFPSLKAIKKNQTDDSCLSDTDLDCYSSHFQALKEELLIRLKDLKELKIPKLVVNPFQADANNANPNLVKELIDLQNDFEGKVLFQQIGYEAFCPNGQVKYPHLWEKIKLLLSEMFFYKCMYVDMCRKARIDGKAPNARVLKYDTKQEISLLDFLCAGRPLVVIFGSCS